jgi:hypothetical protein
MKLRRLLAPARGALAIAVRSASKSTHKKRRALSGAAFYISDIVFVRIFVLCRPGSDLLSQGLSHSTIGAEEFNGRVRDGIGLKLLARTTRPAKDKDTKQAVDRHRRIPRFYGYRK